MPKFLNLRFNNPNFSYFRIKEENGDCAGRIETILLAFLNLRFKNPNFLLFEDEGRINGDLGRRIDSIPPASD